MTSSTHLKSMWMKMNEEMNEAPVEPFDVASF